MKKVRILLALVCFSYFFIAQAKKAIGGGVLPFCFKNGHAYLLLGHENRTWDTHNWTQRAQTRWVWGDFGGSCDAKDADAAQKYATGYDEFCAAREGGEETGFIFGNTFPLPKIDKKKQTESTMFKNSIKFLLNNMQQKFEIRVGNHIYALYFVKVDYIDPILLNKEALKNAHEKNAYVWVKVSEILNILSKNPDQKGFYYVPSIGLEEKNKLFHFLASNLKRADVSAYLVDLDEQAANACHLELLSRDLNQLIGVLNNISKVIA